MSVTEPFWVCSNWNSINICLLLTKRIKQILVEQFPGLKNTAKGIHQASATATNGTWYCISLFLFTCTSLISCQCRYHPLHHVNNAVENNSLHVIDARPGRSPFHLKSTSWIKDLLHHVCHIPPLNIWKYYRSVWQRWTAVLSELFRGECPSQSFLLQFGIYNWAITTAFVIPVVFHRQLTDRPSSLTMQTKSTCRSWNCLVR